MRDTKSPYTRADNQEAWTAWECLRRTGVSIFLTGRAGTGKTTFLRRLQASGVKRMAVVAPTGVAAINAGGVTIHSFFQLPPSLFIPGQPLEQSRAMRQSKLKMIRGIDLLVIDEVSMVRPDLLDAMDARLRQVRRSQAPFGGVQLLLIGDLMQLAPVLTESEAPNLLRHYATPYFFSSKALAQTKYFTIELKHIYRQTNALFIDLLNKVRDNNLDESSLRALNSRYDPKFNPPESEKYIRLTTHNARAETLNGLKLAQLDGMARTYECQTSGTFPEKSYPADKSLTLKVGAQVMFLKNDREGRFYNGKIGHVVDLTPDSVMVTSDDDFGTVEIKAEVWQNFSYVMSKETGQVEQKVEGTFSQIPLSLAWAITIHKSQGLTFDRAIIDAGNSFSPGQVYVALSRCRTFEGLVLSTPISRSCIMTDPSVKNYMGQQRGHELTQTQIDAFAADYAVTVVEDLFDFRGITSCAARILRILEENYATTYPTVIAELSATLNQCQNELTRPSHIFADLCRRHTAAGGNILEDGALMERTKNGAKYFEDKVKAILDPLLLTTDITLGNATLEKQRANARSSLRQELAMKHAALRAVTAGGFDPAAIVAAHAEAVAREPEDTTPKSRPKSDEREVANKELYRELKDWRAEEARKVNRPAYAVAPDKVLMDIADAMPTDSKALLAIKGMGEAKVGRFGADILRIVAEWFEKGARPEAREHQPESPAMRPDTRQLTVEAFRRLRSAEAVAKERGLARSTIVGHLLDTMEETGLGIDDIMGRERHDRLRSLIEAQGPGEARYGKETMKGEFDYREYLYVRHEVMGEKGEKD